MKFHFCGLWLVLVCGLVVSDRVCAQPKPAYSPSSTHIFPAGGRRGQTVQVRLGAECIPPGTEFQLFGDGVSGNSRLTNEVTDDGERSVKRVPTEIPITHPREWAAQIQIEGEAPLGPVYWRVHCAQGGTATRPFIIGDLPEFIETESNSTYETASAVELPVTINGQIHGERDVDHYRFRLAAGQVVSCEVIAGRIGSRLDPVVELLDAKGKRVKVEELHVGSDPVLVHRASTSAEYILRIANVTFRGDPACVYRINVRPQPFPRLALPGGGPAGGTISELRILGITGAGPLWERAGVALPETGDTWNIGLPDGPLALSIDPHKSAVEVEPNNDVKVATTLELPVVQYGQFSSKTDQDVFRFTATKGIRYRFESRAWPPGTPAFPVIEILKPDGSKAASALSATDNDRIARLSWAAPEDGEFFVRLKDLRFGARGGDDFAWRLLAAVDEPDFELAIDTDSLIVTQGKESSLTVKARRHGGFNEPIELNVEGLPEGVTLAPVSIEKGKNSAAIKLKATDVSVSASHVLTVTGTASMGEDKRQKIARCRHLGIDSEGVAIGSPTTGRLHLSVQHKPLFKLFCSEAYLYAHRGSIFRYEMEIQRLEGYDGLIHLQQGDRQNRDMDGVKMLDATFDPGKTKSILPIYLPETMAINVQSQTQLYSQAWTQFKDKHGNDQAMLILSEKRNMLRPLPIVVKLQATQKVVSAKPGSELTCRLKIQRTSNFGGSMKLELLEPKPESGITLAPTTIPERATSVDAILRISRRQPTTKPIPLKFRATGLMDDETVIITETQTKLVVK